MDNIRSLPPMERPREKLQVNGPQALNDAELLAILLGVGTPQLPLHKLCDNLLQENSLRTIAAMDLAALCRFKGIGPAKATILLAAAEYSRRVDSKGLLLPDEPSCFAYVKPLLEQATQLQYLLLLVSTGRELLAFSEAGSVLPDITWITDLAIKAGADRLLLVRNGWPAFSRLEPAYMMELNAACGALHMVCDGLMAVGPERFKMI